ncbi:MAG: 23S rRNA (guanosine(2251)-2'-O)-methyltransferase RlmB [Candidatus Latescibacteria bacterium]|nr:23S rRNA (guanosine(2251)-2'-O)-methyltransferase RlmB [Candidatus Latescibacterota bacterium]MDP7235236.1 23S rRNA (guanosine(2251)-2'-O)-methyltransferase RlmB [Candidatus Latescibacterota bacterium]
MSDIIYGRNSVREALLAGRSLNKILIADGTSRRDIEDIIELARAQGVVYQFADRRNLDQMVREKHQGIVAVGAAHQYVELSDILTVAQESLYPPFLAVLDGIQDPHNLGSIIRTADAVGVHGLIIPRRQAVGLTAVVTKASAGTTAHMQVARVANLNQAMDTLKDAGLWLIGLEADGEAAFDSVDYTGPVAMVIGSEGKGLRPLVRRHCDEVVKLAIGGHAGSLNASVAAAIVLYEVFRQREKK